MHLDIKAKTAKVTGRPAESLRASRQDVDLVIASHRNTDGLE